MADNHAFTKALIKIATDLRAKEAFASHDSRLLEEQLSDYWPQLNDRQKAALVSGTAGDLVAAVISQQTQTNLGHPVPKE